MSPRAKRVLAAVGVLLLSAVAFYAVRTKEERSLFGPIANRITADRSTYTQTPGYTMSSYRQIHIRDLKPADVQRLLEPNLIARGYTRQQSLNTFEAGVWSKPDSASSTRVVVIWDGPQLGMPGSIIMESHDVGWLEERYAHVVQKKILDDPLGQGTMQSFFDRSIPIED